MTLGSFVRFVFPIFVAFAVFVPRCLAGPIPTVIPGFEVRGRLAVSEPHSCDGGTYPDWLETVWVLDWTTCHADKQHMDAAGVPVTTNAFVADALRPLQVTVQVDIWCLYARHSYGDPVPIASVRAQTNAAGRFRVKLPQTPCGIASVPADGLVLRASAWLQYRVAEASGAPIGTVRALWDRTAAATVYTSVLPADAAAWGDWIVPHLILGQQILPVRPPSPVDLGDQTFFDGASSSYTGYLRGMLGAWQTMVNLHQRLQAALAVDGHEALHRGVFINNPVTACTDCYTVYFNTSGAGYGGHGGIALPGPDPSNGLFNYLSLVSIGLPGHEFGHSIHAGTAPASFVGVDNAWIYSQDAAGGIIYGRLPENVDTIQSQDMGMGLVEGFGDAMGNYFMNGCQVRDRAWGDPDPRNAAMNPAAHASCDATDFFCPYRQFRFQMSQRGIAENSPTWFDRLKALDGLAGKASSAGAVMVVSNNELKFSNVVCDLLDSDPDVSYATGQVGGRPYAVDYDWVAAEALDGRMHELSFATYATDPPPEMVTLTLGTLLDAMQAFVPPVAFAGPLPSPIVDGANRAHDDAHISIFGPYSAQALARHLVGSGVVGRADMNGILRGNRMEEIP